MTDSTDFPVTELLRRSKSGDTAARELLFSQLYEPLHRLASKQFSRERNANTLQATALIHETFIQLAGIQEIDWQSRAHFLSIASTMMRRILIDHARTKASQKRFGGTRIDLSSGIASSHDDNVQLIAIDRALQSLNKISPRACQVVEMKYFGGFGFDEIGLALDVSPRTAKRDWDMARKVLYNHLSGSIEEPGTNVAMG
jgi:RNA polymerase sigma-70 factor (ECF subfamily)